jgi:hypothetical protein
VQFSYASPKEKQENRKIGHILAKLRLLSNDPERGRILITLREKNKGLTQTIKDAIIEEAKRKRISWLMNADQHDLV